MDSADSLSPRGVENVFSGPSKPPGFSKRERWFLALALAGIVLWGWTGIDRTEPDERSSSPSATLRRAPASSAFVGGQVDTLADRGEQVFRENGCYACHSIDGSRKIGPTLLGSWGRSESIVDGSIPVDYEEYFYESILEPQAQIVAGFEEAAMPSYEGLIERNDLEALAQYVRSLK